MSGCKLGPNHRAHNDKRAWHHFRFATEGESGEAVLQLPSARENPAVLHGGVPDERTFSSAGYRSERARLDVFEEHCR